ncbi:hypothetical protein Gotur_014116 [Gossypium turneri]
MGGGCKLDPTLVRALVERWRPEVHTFHLPCGECAITLEDVQLQLGLLVDGSLVIELVVAVDWKDRSGQTQLGVSCVEVGKLSWGSAVLVTLYRKMCWATELHKIKISSCMLLLQSWRDELHGTTRGASRYMTSVRSTIGNGLSLVVYAMVEMYAMVGFRQTILPVPQDIKDLHHIDLQGRMDEHWLIFHAKYINLWNNRCEFLPTREAIIAPELACDLECMSWFRHHGKSNLLGEEAGGRQCHTRRP